MMRGNTVVFTDPVCNPRNGQDRNVIPVKFKPARPKSGPPSKALNAILDDDDLMRELLKDQ